MRAPHRRVILDEALHAQGGLLRRKLREAARGRCCWVLLLRAARVTALRLVELVAERRAGAERGGREGQARALRAGGGAGAILCPGVHGGRRGGVHARGMRSAGMTALLRGFCDWRQSGLQHVAACALMVALRSGRDMRTR